MIAHEVSGLAEQALDTEEDAFAVVLEKLSKQEAEAERRARVWRSLQQFAKCCRVLIARKMVEKVIFLIDFPMNFRLDIILLLILQSYYYSHYYFIY